MEENTFAVSFRDMPVFSVTALIICCLFRLFYFRFIV